MAEEGNQIDGVKMNYAVPKTAADDLGRAIEEVRARAEKQEIDLRGNAFAIEKTGAQSNWEDALVANLRASADAIRDLLALIGRRSPPRPQEEEKDNTAILCDNLNRIAADDTTNISEFDRFTVNEAARRLGVLASSRPASVSPKDELFAALKAVADYMRDDDADFSRDVDPEWADLIDVVTGAIAKAEAAASVSPKQWMAPCPVTQKNCENACIADGCERIKRAFSKDAASVSPQPEEQLFPIQDGPAIPWSVIAPFEAQAKKNHGRQDLKRLAERGGLSVCEVLPILHAEDYYSYWKTRLNGEYPTRDNRPKRETLIIELLALIKERQAHASQPEEQRIQEEFAKLEAIIIQQREQLKALASQPEEQKGAKQFVDGYDAEFWRDSYRLLSDAVLKHLDRFVQDDDVAEEAIFVKAIEDAGAALASQPEGWQPIATAPEATYVLLWLSNYGFVRAIGSRPFPDAPVEWWAPEMDGGHGERVFNPSHWMLPLPPAPAGAPGEGDDQ